MKLFQQIAETIVLGLENRGYMDLQFNRDDSQTAKEFVAEVLAEKLADIVKGYADPISSPFCAHTAVLRFGWQPEATRTNLDRTQRYRRCEVE
jgi:hypothetical protein